MVATSIMSTDAEMVAMAGKNVDATGFTDGNKTAWGLQAENFLNVISRHDLSTDFASLTTNTKLILSEYVARYVGMSAIAFNMAAFTSRIEAENMLIVHFRRMRAIEKLIAEQKVITFIKP